MGVRIFWKYRFPNIFLRWSFQTIFSVKRQNFQSKKKKTICGQQVIRLREQIYHYVSMKFQYFQPPTTIFGGVRFVIIFKSFLNHLPTSVIKIAHKTKFSQPKFKEVSKSKNLPRVPEYPPWPGDDFTVFVHCPLSSENELEKVFGQKKLDSGQ